MIAFVASSQLLCANRRLGKQKDSRLPFVFARDGDRGSSMRGRASRWMREEAAAAVEAAVDHGRHEMPRMTLGPGAVEFNLQLIITAVTVIETPTTAMTATKTR